MKVWYSVSVMNKENKEAKVSKWEPFKSNWKSIVTFFAIFMSITLGGAYMFVDNYKEATNFYLTSTLLSMLYITFFTNPIVK